MFCRFITWFAVQCFSSVHCTIIIHFTMSTEPSFGISPPFSVNSTNRFFLYMPQKNKLHLIDLISSDCPWYKHWFSTWSWRNRVMFEPRSVDFKTISVSFTRACTKVLCVATAFIGDVMKFTRHYWRRQWLKPTGSEISAKNVRFDWRLFCLIFFVILYSMLQKGLRMVACALWRSKVFRDVPWQRPYDLHNAPAPLILLAYISNSI